ncbi:hypothetical protein SEUCBS139899_001704 [Sporothrix eucalyptigena]
MATVEGEETVVTPTQSSVPTLRPPATNNKGILNKRAVNISSAQQKLLDSDAAWLDSNGRPGPGFMPVPDKVLKRLQKQAAPKSRSQTPSEQVQQRARPQQTALQDAPVQETIVATSEAEIVVAGPTATPKATPAKKATQSGGRQNGTVSTSARSNRSKLASVPVEEPVPHSTPPTLQRQPSPNAPAPAEDVQTAEQADNPVQMVEQEPEIESGTAPEVEPEMQTRRRPGDPSQSPNWASNPRSDEDDDIIRSQLNVDDDAEGYSGEAYIPQVEGAHEQQQDLPQQQQPLVSPPRAVPDWTRSHPSNIVSSSSPAAMEVDIPDALVEGRSSWLHKDVQAAFARSNQQHPASSSPPPPVTPGMVSRQVSARSAVRTNDMVEQSLVNNENSWSVGRQSVGGYNRSICDSPSASRPVTASNSGAPREATKPRRYRMKMPVFPASAKPSMRMRPSMNDLQTNSRASSRRSSLAGVSTRDPSVSPTSTPGRKWMSDSANISRQETSIPSVLVVPAPAAPEALVEEPVEEPVAPRETVEAPPSPPTRSHIAPIAEPVKVSSPVVMQAPAVQEPTVEKQAVEESAPRTWMLPYDAFVAAYPDYKGDLENFLRACYSLQHTNPGMLPSFLFDDIVHAFLDYIEYVHALQTSGSSPPQNLTQWYNINATALVCKKSVVTRENVSSILRAYPDNVRAISQNAVLPSSPVNKVDKQDEARVKETANAVAPATTPAWAPPTQDQFNSHQSLPPGRPFPYDEEEHGPIADESSGPPNSILALTELRDSNSTVGSGLRHGQGHAKSPHPHDVLGSDYHDGDISLDRSYNQGNSQEGGHSYSQDYSHAPLGQTRPIIGATQSSWLDDYNDSPLQLPSSPIASSSVPAGMDKRMYLLRSPESVPLTRPQLPSTQDLLVHEESIAETPARNAVNQNRSRQELETRQSGTVTEEVIVIKDAPPPAVAVTKQRTPQQVVHVEDEVENEAEEEDEDMGLFDQSLMSVQSAIEARRSISPPTPRDAAARKAIVDKERRRATIAASDIGIVARMAAEETERVAPKRKLPPSMASASKPAPAVPDMPDAAVQADVIVTESPAEATDELPKKKKKKKAPVGDRTSIASEKFRKFLERKLGRRT